MVRLVTSLGKQEASRPTTCVGGKSKAKAKAKQTKSQKQRRFFGDCFLFSNFFGVFQILWMQNKGKTKKEKKRRHRLGREADCRPNERKGCNDRNRQTREQTADLDRGPLPT
jgi:hypothetical protein